MPFDPKNVNICDHVVTSRKAGQHVLSVYYKKKRTFVLLGIFKHIGSPFGTSFILLGLKFSTKNLKTDFYKGIFHAQTCTIVHS